MNLSSTEPTYRELLNKNAELEEQLAELRERHAELEELLKEYMERIDPSLSNGP